MGNGVGAVRDKADPTPLESTSRMIMAATMIKVTAIDFRLRVVNFNILVLLENRLNAQIS